MPTNSFVPYRHLFYLVFYPRLRLQLRAEGNCLIIVILYVNLRWIITTDRELRDFHLGRILVLINVYFDSESIKCPNSIACVGIESVLQGDGNCRICWQRDTGDKELIESFLELDFF